MAKLSESLETASKRWEHALVGFVRLTAPVWIPGVLYAGIRALLEGAGDLNTVFGLIVSALLVTVLLLLFQLWRHTCGAIETYSFREFFTVLLGFVLVFTSSFAVLSSLLHELDLAEYSSARYPIEPGPLADYYMWHLIDSIPSLEIWNTLDIANRINAEDRPARLLILVYRTSIITPVIALSGKWLNWKLKGAPMAGRWDTLTVDGAEMRVYVTAPDGAGPHPAVVVIQHAGGVDDFVQTMTDRIAAAGFVGAAPDLYHRDDPRTSDDALTRMSRLRDRNIIADVNATIEHLKGMPAVRADRIGITGFCMGGRVAYLMAAQAPELKASVVFYGGNTMVSWGEGTPPFEQSDRIACPVLGLFGEDDGNPNPADVAKIDAELTRLGKAHEFHSYAGAGHAFMSEGRPSYREEAAADAWQKCVAWFQQHLA